MAAAAQARTPRQRVGSFMAGTKKGLWMTSLAISGGLGTLMLRAHSIVKSSNERSGKTCVKRGDRWLCRTVEEQPVHLSFVVLNREVKERVNFRGCEGRVHIVVACRPNKAIALSIQNIVRLLTARLREPRRS